MTEQLTVEALRKLLRYEPVMGKLYWRERDASFFSEDKYCKQWNTRYAGEEALTSLVYGYRHGSILGVNHRAQRVIWAMETGEWPVGDVDHINHDRADNRFENLRDVSRGENLKNQGVRSDNVSGIVGVRLYRATGKWIAAINVDGISKHLGYFKCITAASISRKLADQKYGYHENHGTLTDGKPSIRWADDE